MNNKEDIVKNWLPRYTGMAIEQFGQYILLTNFSKYVDLFATWNNVEVIGRDKPMQCATFDGITIIPTFVLAPLVYLGGVFYSADILPAFWRFLTYLNPIYYIINGFRYGFLGISDVPLWLCAGIMVAAIGVLAGVNWWLLKTGLGLKQ